MKTNNQTHAKMHYLANRVKEHLQERNNHSDVKVNENFITFSYQGYVFYLELVDSYLAIGSNSQIMISDARGIIKKKIVLNYTQHDKIFLWLDIVINQKNNFDSDFLTIKEVFIDSLKTTFKNYNITEVVREEAEKSFFIDIKTKKDKSCILLEVKKVDLKNIVVSIVNQDNTFNTEQYNETNFKHFLWLLLTKTNNNDKMKLLFSENESWEYEEFYIYLPSLLSFLEKILIADRFEVVNNKQSQTLNRLLDFFIEEKWTPKNIYTNNTIHSVQKKLKVGEVFTLNVYLPEEIEFEYIKKVLVNVDTHSQEVLIEFNDMFFRFEYEEIEEVFKPLQELAESLQ